MAVDWEKLVYANASTPYLDNYTKYEKNVNAQAEKDRAAMADREKIDLNKSNAGYDSTARQNYINYMQAQKALPSSLNSLGIRGGASESSLIRLGSNYGTNVSQNEAARQTALKDIRDAYAQQLADYNKSLSERLATAKATAQENQLKWESEQADKDLQRFSGVIEGLYNDVGSYLTLIEKLKASKDPNKDMKILLATHAMNALAKEQEAASSGGGGGYSRGYSSGGYGGYSSGGYVDSDAAKASASDIVARTAAAASGVGGSISGRGSSNRGNGRYYSQREDYYVGNGRRRSGGATR